MKQKGIRMILWRMVCSDLWVTQVPLIPPFIYIYKIILAKSLKWPRRWKKKKQYWFVYSLQPVNLLKPKLYSLLFSASNLNIPRGIWVRLVEPHDMQSSLKYPDWKCIRLNRVATTKFFSKITVNTWLGQLLMHSNYPIHPFSGFLNDY